MRRLDYHPNAMARGLVRQKIHTLGVLFGQAEESPLSNPYLSGVLQGVLLAATENGYNVTIVTAPWMGVERSVSSVRDARTDGLLIVAPRRDNDMLAGVAGSGVPVVCISATGTEFDLPSVDVDNQLGSWQATQYLIGLGHRRIAHVSGEASHFSVVARREGFRRAMGSAGIVVPDGYEQSGTYNWNHAVTNRSAVRRLLELPSPPTAIVCGNDWIALAALDEAHASGVRVPEQLSVVGFDDVPAARLVTPALTTIRQAFDKIGESATRLLIELLDHGQPEEPVFRLWEPSLVERASTGPPP